MGDCDVERFIFPDGTERDMLVFDNRSAAACAPPRSRSRDAHVCPLCGSALVHPTDWRRTTAATWRITLRCPNCETIRTLTLTRTEVERLNKALYEGTEQLARQADQLARRNFQEETEKFVAALDADLILPLDF